MTNGVAPSQLIREMIKKGAITSEFEIKEENIQPATLDLTISDEIWRINASFHPNEDETVIDLLNNRKFTSDHFKIGAQTTLEVGVSYVIKLRERLNLPDGFSAKSNPKSSIGRSDIFIRLITDYNTNYDTVTNGYNGDLYLEITPLTHRIRIHPGIKLNQIRFFYGTNYILDEAQLKLLYRDKPLLYRSNGSPLTLDEANIKDNTLLLTANIKSNSLTGYRAKKNFVDFIDLSGREKKRKEDFWEVLITNDGILPLEANTFYILSSKERVFVPPEYAAEMVPYIPIYIEARSHYAGFFDPLWNATATLELRPRDVPFMLRDGMPLCGLIYQKMIEIPDKLYGKEIGSNYTDQEGPTLSKFFY